MSKQRKEKDAAYCARDTGLDEETLVRLRMEAGEVAREQANKVAKTLAMQAANAAFDESYTEAYDEGFQRGIPQSACPSRGGNRKANPRPLGCHRGPAPPSRAVAP